MRSLTINPNCAMNMSDKTVGYSCGSINRLESGNQVRHTWYDGVGDGITIRDIYNNLVSLGKRYNNYSINYDNLITARNDQTSEAYQKINERFSFCVGGIDNAFLAFGLENNNTSIRLLMYSDDFSNGDTRAIPIQVGTGSGSNEDAVFYICDKYYYGGVESSNLQPTTSPPYNIEYVQIPVLQPIYETIAEKNLNNVVTYNGNDFYSDTTLFIRRSPACVRGIDVINNKPITDLFNAHEYIPDPNEGGGSDASGGGGGTPWDNVPIHPDPLPQEMLLDSGIIQMYSPTIAQMQAFTQYIYSGSDSFYTNIKKIWSNPIDSIISFSMIPFNAITGDSEIVKFCGIETDVSMRKVLKQFMTINCGEITLSGDYSSYLDYSGYSVARLYLPFVGIVDLNIDDVMNSTMKLYYNVDLFTGESQAYLWVIKKDESMQIDIDGILYTWDANVVYSSPLSGNNWQQLYNGVAKVITSGIQGALTAGGGGALMGGVSALSNTVLSQHVSVSRSGTLKANSGFMGNYTPFIIFESPIASVPTSQGKYKGYPSDKQGKLKNFHGYTEVDESTLFLNKLPSYITDEEVTKIHEMLSNGIIIP